METHKFKLGETVWFYNMFGWEKGTVEALTKDEDSGDPIGFYATYTLKIALPGEEREASDFYEDELGRSPEELLETMRSRIPQI